MQDFCLNYAEPHSQHKANDQSLFYDSIFFYQGQVEVKITIAKHKSLKFCPNFVDLMQDSLLHRFADLE